MAELLLKIGSVTGDPNFQDGDVLMAFNKKRIEWQHIQIICNPELVGFNGDGLRPVDGLPKIYKDMSFRFRFERVSKNEIRKINLADMSEEIIGNDKKKKEYIDVPRAIYNLKYSFNEQSERMTLNLHHEVFGMEGKEFWYGGKQDFSQSCCDAMWGQIEAQGNELRQDCQEYKWGVNEHRSHLIVPVDEFDDEECKELEASEFDKSDSNNWNLLRLRNKTVDWEKLQGVSGGTIDKIKDRKTPIDLRKFSAHDRAEIVITKPDLGGK